MNLLNQKTQIKKKKHRLMKIQRDLLKEDKKVFHFVSQVKYLSQVSQNLNVKSPNAQCTLT